MASLANTACVRIKRILDQAGIGHIGSLKYQGLITPFLVSATNKTKGICWAELVSADSARWRFLSALARRLKDGASGLRISSSSTLQIVTWSTA
jgi:hypothetical protein